MSKQRKFAAFDIDGTIGRTSLFLQVVEELIRRDHLPKSFLFELEKKLENYKKRTSEDAFTDYSQMAVKILFDNIQSVKVMDYRKAVDTVMKQAREYVYVYTRDLIRDLKEQGYFLIALSGSEMYAVEEFAKHYNFDVAIGEFYHEKDGHFTGQIDEVFHRKDTFLEKLIVEHGLTKEGSIAIGDSMGDYSMLAFVENPIVFNPEKRLYEKARGHKWPIVIERKNVIYELESTDKSYRLK